ncbi:hypothetical protein FRC20_000598 [Serendipita sp. 405]|nr:hypothetical protein FRC20_000598 [Serendipita sp. 405]
MASSKESFVALNASVTSSANPVYVFLSRFYDSYATFQKMWKKILTSKRVMLSIGILVGFAACTLLLTNPPSSLSLLLEEYDLPTLGAAEVEWKELFSGNSPLVPWNIGRANFDGREFCVGEELSARGLRAKHPVILIPGIISTALENWSTQGEYKAQFRKRYWGGASMVMRAIQNPERWMAALMLDPETGLDPPGVKIRAAQGIDAAQKFIEGYWLWEKILQNLAALNYDTNNLELAAYDWRLSYRNLEIRDGYFSRLKHAIESYKKRQGKKTVMVAHSMGATVALVFFTSHYTRYLPVCSLKWVEAEEGGKGGPQWVEDHIEAIVSVGGTFLVWMSSAPLQLFSHDFLD